MFELGESISWREPEERVVEAGICREFEPVEDFSCDIERTVDICVDGFSPVGGFGFRFFIYEFVFGSSSEAVGLDDRDCLCFGKLRSVSL